MRWLVDALAVFRLTRLITTDGLTEELRLAIEERADRDGAVAWAKASELVGCPWCVSMWFALGLVLLVRRQSWWPSMADALALSAAASLLAEHAS